MDGSRNAPAISVGVAITLTGVAALEHTVAPWAPFYVVYAILTTTLPFLLGTVRLGRPSPPRVTHLIAAVALAFGLQALFRLITSTTDLSQMFGAVFAGVAGRWRAPPAVLAARYLLFIQIWAGLGEEIFYRGFVQGQLRRRFRPLTSIAIASGLYAVRHYTQVLVASPTIPWWPATVWVAGTFVVGIGLGLLYERTRSLLPPILCHYVFNLLA